MSEDSRGSGNAPPRRGANTLPGVLQYVAGIEGGELWWSCFVGQFPRTHYSVFSLITKCSLVTLLLSVNYVIMFLCYLTTLSLIAFIFPMSGFLFIHMLLISNIWSLIPSSRRFRSVGAFGRRSSSVPHGSASVFDV